MGRLTTPPGQRPRTVEASSLSFESEGPPVSGDKAQLQALLAEADAQEQTMDRGAVRFKKGYRA
jgi:hypothetical protein